MFFFFYSHLIYQQALNENPLKVLSVLFTTAICRCFSKLKGICKREPHANLVNEQILHLSVWPDGINVNHFDLPKEKNLEIIIFQEGESFIQHRWMTGISFVVFFSSSSLLQRRDIFLSDIHFASPVPSNACASVQVGSAKCTLMCTLAHARAPQLFFFFTDSVHPSSPPPLVCDGAVVVRRHPQRRDDGILRLCL